jgi:hypothetical protein
MEAMTLPRGGETIKFLQSRHSPITLALRAPLTKVAHLAVATNYFDPRYALSETLVDQQINWPDFCDTPTAVCLFIELIELRT